MGTPVPEGTKDGWYWGIGQFVSVDQDFFGPHISPGVADAAAAKVGHSSVNLYKVENGEIVYRIIRNTPTHYATSPPDDESDLLGF